MGIYMECGSAVIIIIFAKHQDSRSTQELRVTLLVERKCRLLEMKAGLGTAEIIWRLGNTWGSIRSLPPTCRTC